MKRTIVITLDVPDDMQGIGPWNAEQSLESYVGHWLEQGYFIHDYTVELPSGNQY